MSDKFDWEKDDVHMLHQAQLGTPERLLREWAAAPHAKAIIEIQQEDDGSGYVVLRFHTGDHTGRRYFDATVDTAYTEEGPPGELTAWDRAETDACERGTPGCSVHHTRDSECQTW
jgi:hypothetical protein